jgi:hypothetical protein
MLWRRATLSIGAPLGNLQQGSLTGGLERQEKSARSTECLCLWELWEGGLLYWELGKLGLISTQRRPGKYVRPYSDSKDQTIVFNRTQAKVFTGLLL